jgi:hypothetical protein
MIWIIIGLIAVIVICLILWRGPKGPTHTLESIESPIGDLLRRGFNGGFLIIDLCCPKYFLQLRKYIRSPGNYGIELCFPNAKWSERLFVKLSDFCNSAGIVYTISKENSDNSIEFLHVDFGRDIIKAHNIIKNIILKVFELDEGVKIFVRLENATADNKLVDK